MTWDRPHLMPEEFDAVARFAAREAEGLRLELIEGRVSSKALVDGDRGWIVAWFTRTCLESRPDLWAHPWTGLKTGADRAGRAVADAVLAPSNAFVGQGDWRDPEPVLAVLEVTSGDVWTDRCRRDTMPGVYAATGIPAYLLVDRDARTVTIQGEPDAVRYRYSRTAPFGTQIDLPEPVGVMLRTESFDARVG
ncbi:Uma2 family endonuclease [Streptomyces sp. NPDC048603]|uniref:Uma2 family endonuclease n=1 Tax=Streptomyces sp. NPDC048603 TaxID=3365577 RepID=UPI0037192250